MKRFSPNELSTNRIFHAVARRIWDYSHTFTWKYPSFQTLEMKKRLNNFANLHSGKRCFIIGNGPSIADMDLAQLKNEITFGLNRIYLAFDKMPFRPSYYVCINELVLEQFCNDIQTLGMPKFLNWNRKRLFDIGDSKTLFIKLGLRLLDTFVTDLQLPLSSGATVTYVAMQIAYFMGFDEVILIGVDHNFADKGTPNKVALREQAEDQNHFHPDYFPKGSKWQLPDLRRSEIAYQLARDTFEKDGRRILDATIDGKCPIFEKVDFYSLF